MKTELEVMIKANLLVDSLKQERDTLRKDLIKSLSQYKEFFEHNWDYDPDLMCLDKERDHYRWVITKLGEMLEHPYPNYIDQIDELENKLPY